MALSVYSAYYETHNGYTHALEDSEKYGTDVDARQESAYKAMLAMAASLVFMFFSAWSFASYFRSRSCGFVIDAQVQQWEAAGTLSERERRSLDMQRHEAEMLKGSEIDFWRNLFFLFACVIGVGYAISLQV